MRGHLIVSEEVRASTERLLSRLIPPLPALTYEQRLDRWHRALERGLPHFVSYEMEGSALADMCEGAEYPIMPHPWDRQIDASMLPVVVDAMMIGLL